jgi:transcriptional regulator with XRE-family HTH domain
MDDPTLIDPDMIAADQMVAIAERLTAERKRIGFSKRELARQVGVTCESVRRWENAQSAPSFPALAAFHRLGMDVCLVVTGEPRSAGAR